MRYTLLAITTLLLLFVVSGCVDRPQTPAEKAGWDQAKYEEYSAYYDWLLFNYDALKLNQSEIHNVQTKGWLNTTKGKTIEEWLIDIPKDKSEFEKTWYLVFYYFQKVELENKRTVCARTSIETHKCLVFKQGGDKKVKDGYLQKAAEYRQKIEELKLNSSGDGKIKMKSNSSEDGKTKLRLNSSEDGKVNIVEFLKFDCSHCYYLHKSLPSLLKKYEGKITITYIPIVGLQESTKSIEAYIIAEQMGKGEEMRDALFQAKFQKGLDIMENTIAIEDAAAGIGLGADFKAKLEGGEAKKAALDNIGMMSDYGIQGTPTLILNGNITVDPPTIANLEEVVGSMMNASSQSSSR